MLRRTFKIDTNFCAGRDGEGPQGPTRRAADMQLPFSW